jgi:uncharacterized membrane protein
MKSIGNIIAPAHFVLFAALLTVSVPAGIALSGWRLGFLVGFDIAATGFLLSIVPLLVNPGPHKMRARAQANDANRVALLVITGIVMAAVMTAIAAELAARGRPSPGAIALVVATLALAWLFSNMVYVLHYAHVFYVQHKGADKAGLDFPGCVEPDYWDFAYFAFTLGMTFQTSDVAVRARALRKTVLFHTLAAFVFNIGVLAFSINVLGG